MLTHDNKKQQWAEEHALCIEQKFEQWQKPLGIDDSEYSKYLAEELIDCWDEPLLKSLIESIS